MNNNLDLDDMEYAPAVAAVAKLAQAAIQPHVQARPDGTSYALYPDGKIIELTREPIRKRGSITVQDRDSFLEYVQKHTTGGTLVCVEWTHHGLIGLTAVLDHHDAKSAGWAGHYCRAVLTPSPAWLAWVKYDRHEFAQRAFAEFIEENAPGVVVDPSAADMLELATTLEATANAQFKSHHRLQNGDREFIYKHTTEARAGTDGQLVIPRSLSLKVAPFARSQPLTLTARFKYRLDGPGLALFYEIEGLEDVKQAMLEDMRTSLRDDLGGNILVLLAAPPSTTKD